MRIPYRPVQPLSSLGSAAGRKIAAQTPTVARAAFRGRVQGLGGLVFECVGVCTDAGQTQGLRFRAFEVVGLVMPWGV